MLVTLGKSTSVNTLPKPRTCAAVDEPGKKNVTSVTLLLKVVNNRCAEKGANKLAYEGLIFQNSTGVEVGLILFALT